MPGRNMSSSYRYNYQGQENAVNSKWEAFELRMHNPDLGRWMSPDPAGQFHSPYISMANNPISGVDPDGGYTNSGMTIMQQGMYNSMGARNYGIWQWLEHRQKTEYEGKYYYPEELLNILQSKFDNMWSNYWSGVWDKEDMMITKRPDIDPFGNETFQDVDAGRFKWAEIGNRMLDEVMSNRSTYEVTYYATMEDYQNGVNGTYLFETSELGIAMLGGGIYAGAMRDINSQIGIENNQNASNSGFISIGANTNSFDPSIIVQKTLIESSKSNDYLSMKTYISTLGHQGKSPMDLVYDLSGSLLETVYHYGNYTLSIGYRGSEYKIGTDNLSFNYFWGENVKKGEITFGHSSTSGIHTWGTDYSFNRKELDQKSARFINSLTGNEYNNAYQLFNYYRPYYFIP